tara:strand:+ start:135 stop:2810 length:2676 start_codon:yes stop_codon:yes gene_type:complete
MLNFSATGTALAITSSETSIFPYYTIPVAIAGVGPSVVPDEVDELSELADVLTSDEKWKKYILGGTYNTVFYPGIYSQGVFNVNNFSFDLPYDLLSAKAVDPENYPSYQTVERKSVYSMHLPSYQKFNAENKEGDLLNIYDLLYCSVLDQNSTFTAVKDQITLGGIYNHDTTSVFDPEELEVPALIKTLSEIPPADPATATWKYTDAYQAIRKYYYDYEENTKPSGTQQQDLFFNADAIQDVFHNAYINAESHGAYYPFYNKIGLPAFGSGPLNELIVETEFDNLLLNSIKDAFITGDYETSENSFTYAATDLDLDENGELYDRKTVTNKILKYVDFKNVLARVNNQPIPLSTSPSRFVGGNQYINRAATDYTGRLSQLNKQKSFALLDRIQKVHLSIDPIAPPADVSAETYMPWSTVADFSISKFMDLANSELNQKAECVAFRINKRNATTGEEFNFIIQNQPYNTYGRYLPEDINPEEWCYYDTQVKYGETYIYTTYAYFMVVGYQYEYADMVLSRRISEYGQYAASDLTFSGTEGDYTCIEFYDPSTGLATPSPMKTRSSPHFLEPLRINLLDEVESEGYATSAQELAKDTNINWADFNLKIEPTIKIFEIPVDSSPLTVLDNPPPTPDVQPYQVKSQSQTVGFYVKLQNPPVKEDSNRNDMYPTPTNELERINYARYLASQNMLSTDKLTLGTVSRPSVLEVYRLSHKPMSMSDFDSNLVGTKSLIISENNDEDNRTYISPTCFYEERITSGHKFYYAFRFLNENNMPSPWTPVVEVELIDDGGYKYTNFNTIIESELGIGSQYEDPSTQFKKIFMLKPALPQIFLSSENLNYDETSVEQFDNVQLAGDLSDSLWNKKYKIRLTSKKTGKKIDLNVSYKLTEDNSTD